MQKRQSDSGRNGNKTMAEYVFDDWVLCCRKGHKAGGDWYHAKECPVCPPIEPGDTAEVVKVDYEKGIVTMTVTRKKDAGGSA